MTTIEQFHAQLAEQIIASGGSKLFPRERAEKLATEVLRRLREIGVEAFPSLLDEDGLRFVYQWDLEPPVLTIMWWDETMWQDMARLVLPPELVV
ncbi:MAG: hypothetical protein ACM3XM_04510 [Mycobacterium leprae]